MGPNGLEQVLQQGPPHVLSECTTYAPVVEEIGQMWGPINVGTGTPAAAGSVTGVCGSSGGTGSGSGGGDGSGAGVAVDPGTAVDPALSSLILRFATMIVLKVGGESCCVARVTAVCLLQCCQRGKSW